MVHNKNFIYTEEDHCLGCNKCIFMCPTNANKALWKNEENKVLIKDGFCISCSECISICDHDARDYDDDTEQFFDDLFNGNPITLIVAPAAKSNFSQLHNLFGFFKERNVKNIFDVSYGADICIWAYLKTIHDKKITTAIAQPCPVIVSYIEKFHPNLINNLMPIHSPVICTSIYLKKYENMTDKVAFLSPCIGKKRESIDENTTGFIDYNVTFSNLLKYIEKNNINLNEYTPSNYNVLSGAWGSLFSRPGGLSENIKAYVGDSMWVKQVEGIRNVIEYLTQYEKDIASGNPVPQIIDALNCQHGCNLGTGTNKKVTFNNIDYLTNNIKSSVSFDNAKKLIEEFDERFDINDFARKYTDKSDFYSEDKNIDIEKAFDSLGKITEDDKNINCFSCGYGSCYDLANAIAKGENHINNCRQYILNKFISISSKDELTDLKNRYAFTIDVKKIEKQISSTIGIIFIDINHLKSTNDKYGHKEGDKLIITCANIIKSMFPENAYRIGGDEFIILLPNISEKEFAKEKIDLKNLFDKNDNVKVSIGAHWNSTTKKLIKSIEKADEEMYSNKLKYYESKNEKRKPKARPRSHILD